VGHRSIAWAILVGRGKKRSRILKNAYKRKPMARQEKERLIEAFKLSPRLISS